MLLPIFFEIYLIFNSPVIATEKKLMVEQNDLVPLVTIFTVVYNGERTIQRAIASVAEQNYPNIEYIVVDGGSDDRTLDIVRDYDQVVSRWISEKDDGIYDAMNKAVNLSTGEYLIVLNADDWLEPTAVSDSIAQIRRTSADFSYSSVFYHLNNEIRQIRPLSESKIYDVSLQCMPFPHISLCASRKIYDELQGFNVEYKVAGDFDFIYRMLRRGYRGTLVNVVIGNVDAGGVSFGMGATRENYRIVLAHGKNKITATLKYFEYCLKFIVRLVLPVSLFSLLLNVKRSRYR